MQKHPTVLVPNIGPMDHAWDLLGEWDAVVELPNGGAVAHGTVTFPSWTEAELELDPSEAAVAGLPQHLPLERMSRIHRTDAGGGALQWVLHAPAQDWSLQATLWPGALHLFVHENEEDDELLWTAHARRAQDYYRRKYPLEGIE